MELQDIIHSICPLPGPSFAQLAGHFTERHYRKGHMLFRTHRVEQELYFMAKGLARAYTVQDGLEVTFWFGWEGAPLLSMKSYVLDQSSYEDVELLEDATLYAINKNVLKALYLRNLDIANWGRRFAEQELVRAEERLISRQVKTADLRYRELVQAYPDIILRAQLRHIASYLGITPVTLSRIRANFI